MKNPARIRTGLVAALWMFMGTHVMGQGSLTPPGAPGETMHTLEEVYERTDPRTPISSLPYTISEPGSYYVTGNLSSTSNGIVIQASGVTVDLMGFTLTGDGGQKGIFVDGSTNAAIDKVLIRGGKTSGFYTGIFCSQMNNSRIEQMVVSGNTGTGVPLQGDHSGQCNGNTIADCTISGNENDGIHLYGYSGQCNGNIITDCTISDNGGNGIGSFNHSGQCNGNTFTDCAINGNGGDGVSLSGSQAQCNGNTITDCTISGNEDDAIVLSGYQGQCNGNTIRENMISRNAGMKGIYLSHANGNRIEGNNIWGATGTGTGTGNRWGIRTYSCENNLILKNSCVGYGTNYDLDSSDTAGPIVSASGFLSATGDAAHPWANFSR